MTARMQKPASLTLIFLITIIVSSVAQADCQVDATTLYKSFKHYRQQINTATKMEELTHFFSANFNRYFTNKLESADSDDVYQTYLTQYWDNLNTAKDIVIVFDYSAHCHNSAAHLVLVSILSSEPATIGSKVELWSVTINYINESNEWKIDSFDYGKLHAGRKYTTTDIKDNFIKIR
jgi:hypothetical protein